MKTKTDYLKDQVEKRRKREAGRFIWVMPKFSKDIRALTTNRDYDLRSIMLDKD